MDRIATVMLALTMLALMTAGCKTAPDATPQPSPASADPPASPLASAVVHGMLISPSGLPLLPDDVAFLFPDLIGHDELAAAPGDDGVAEILPFTADSGVTARWQAGSRSASAAIDVEHGRFRVDVPADAHGEVVLWFRGEAVETTPFHGADVAELTVDIADLRARLGTLELEVKAAASEPVTLRVARLAAGTAPRAEFALRGVPTRLRLLGIPAGSYRVAASGRGSAEAVVSVLRGQQTTLRLDLTAPANR